MKGVVSWADTDASGRFHFTAALRWAEEAEHALLRDRHPEVDIGHFPRRAVEAVYHRGLRSGDEYTVDVDIERRGRSSITFVWTISTDGIVCVEGRHTAVHVNDAGESEPLPDGRVTHA